MQYVLAEAGSRVLAEMCVLHTLVRAVWEPDWSAKV